MGSTRGGDDGAGASSGCAGAAPTRMARTCGSHCPISLRDAISRLTPIGHVPTFLQATDALTPCTIMYLMASSAVPSLTVFGA